MTRPQKESDMKREHRVTIRLTDTEFSIIENTAEQADMTISEYMRKQIMEGQVNTKFEIVADVKEIKKLIGELGTVSYTHLDVYKRQWFPYLPMPIHHHSAARYTLSAF